MFTTPPFRRAPWLLFRRPVLLVAIIGTALILGMVASMTPLFRSSTASEGLQRQLEGRCRSTFAAKMPVVFFEEEDLPRQLETTRQMLRSATAADPAFEPPTLVLRGSIVDLTPAGEDEPSSEVQIFGLEDFREHLTLVEGEHGEGGAYIDQRTAEAIGAGPGDDLDLTIEIYNRIENDFEFVEVPVSVTAVFDDLSDEYIDPYWCALEDALAPNAFGDPPPAPLILDTTTFEDDPESFLGVFAFGHGDWQVPVRIEGLTVTGAHAAATTISETNKDLRRLLSEAFGEPVSDGFEVSLQSDLLGVTERVAAQGEALQTSILPLAAVVLLASVGLLGAAGSYWVERRRAELELLSAVGVPPVGIAIKAGLELLLPVLAGHCSAGEWGTLSSGWSAPPRTSSRSPAATVCWSRSQQPGPGCSPPPWSQGSKRGACSIAGANGAAI